jgi:hypothetical protein
MGKMCCPADCSTKQNRMAFFQKKDQSNESNSNLFMVHSTQFSSLDGNMQEQPRENVIESDDHATVVRGKMKKIKSPF